MKRLNARRIFADNSQHMHPRHSRTCRWCSTLLVIITVAALSSACSTSQHDIQESSSASSSTRITDTESTSPASSTTHGIERENAPTPHPNAHQQALLQAKKRVSTMSINDQAAQLVMVPLQAGTPVSSIQHDIHDMHIGSVLLFGNSHASLDAISTETSTIQSYATGGDSILIATDQEGGSVQHLQGEGFTRMPSAFVQGQMSAQELRAQAQVWGSQLHAAGVNVNFAPSVDTVQAQPRSANAAIGALNRDFGLDAAGNAAHASAFIQGMSQAAIITSIKHYPGLGAVAGNTDFTSSAITDTSTTLQGEEISAFDTVLAEQPRMVMMSLARYANIDPNNPAAFSSTIIRDHLRGDQGYEGVVVSDSLSAKAVSTIPVAQLGVRFIEAGGDLICADAPGYIDQIFNGIVSRSTKDSGFADQIRASATRILTLKYEMKLIS